MKLLRKIFAPRTAKFKDGVYYLENNVYNTIKTLDQELIDMYLRHEKFDSILERRDKNLRELESKLEFPSVFEIADTLLSTNKVINDTVTKICDKIIRTLNNSFTSLIDSCDIYVNNSNSVVYNFYSASVEFSLHLYISYGNIILHEISITPFKKSSEFTKKASELLDIEDRKYIVSQLFKTIDVKIKEEEEKLNKEFREFITE